MFKHTAHFWILSVTRNLNAFPRAFGNFKSLKAFYISLPFSLFLKHCKIKVLRCHANPKVCKEAFETELFLIKLLKARQRPSASKVLSASKGFLYKFIEKIKLLNFGLFLCIIYFPKVGHFPVLSLMLSNLLCIFLLPCIFCIFLQAFFLSCCT